MTARPRDVLVVRSGHPRRAAPPARGHCDRCAHPDAFAARPWRRGVCLACGFEAGVVDLTAPPAPVHATREETRP